MKEQKLIFFEENQNQDVNEFISGLNKEGYRVIQVLYIGFEYGYKSFYLLVEK